LARRSNPLERPRILAALQHRWPLKYEAALVREINLTLTVSDQHAMGTQEIRAEQH